ncbi:MMPL family transporter [Streptomyces sp. N2-109]|uniref:MMPL family transporter n=1 Tax=Streptomyces gossypii TaxID=2883101 RepID=A0ABT2JNV6_9ACTN|nr:MMPL family transporter [Streptomyces gossypii]MCT2589551.1 MMPL family transporter [Streptomyces gossypii]
MLRESKPSAPSADPPPVPPSAPSPPARTARGGFFEAVAAWSARHRALALTGWFALIALTLLGSSLAGAPADTTDPGEAGRATTLMREAGAENSTRENVLIQARDKAGDQAGESDGGGDGPQFADSPAVRDATADLVSALREGDAAKAVARVGSPLGEHGERWLSEDRRSALVTFEITGADAQFEAHDEAATKALSEVRERHPGTRMVRAGDASLSGVVEEGIQDDFKRAEYLSLPLTLLILLVVFGSLLAAGIPLLLAGTSVAGAFGLLQLLAPVVAFNSAASSMVLLIGVAVGVDYSLFSLRRVREERAAGRELHEALRITARTSGHAVLVSGLTVIVCVCGLWFTGVDQLQGLTVGTILVVGLALLGSVTALPALLATLGDRIHRSRIPWLGRRRTAATGSRLWEGIAGTAVRRPLLTGGLSVLALLIMATPALDIRLQDAAVTESLPRDASVTVDAAVRIQEEFPGSPTPARVVVRGETDAAELRQAVDALHSHAAAPAADGLLLEPITVTPITGDLLEVRVPLAGPGTDPTSVRALKHLREEALPATLGKLHGVDYAVSGRTALPHDFAEQVNDRTPYVFAFILILAFLLLLITFRSLAIPLVSIALNLLSVGAAYGVLAWVFQDGNLEGALGFTSYGGVVSWLPLFMFVILFGLSMDYHIFILSRIRERWGEGAGVRDSIIGGISSSAGVVTSAAVIMTAAFSVFMTLSAIEYKMMGVGMGFAILIDATLVRGVLLPAALSLLGHRAWTLPGRG